MKNQGISEEEINQHFTKVSYDYQLYDILAEYVEGVYKAFKTEMVEEQIFNEINEQTNNMAVGSGNHRPKLRNPKDVLLTIKNLCFTWVGFHSHTFSLISTGTYALLRPSMLQKQIP